LKDPATKYNKLIVALSVIIPLAVAALFGIKVNVDLPIFLPPVYASINASTALVLIMAVWSIKSNKRKLHERLMKTAILLSVIFLMLYIAYHITSDSTIYGGTGIIKYFYYFILISHILLSITLIPFVLITYFRAITSDFKRHKKIAKFTFPLWLYVTISGVLVYLMIAPYY
jgi:putative membrane protein